MSLTIPYIPTAPRVRPDRNPWHLVGDTACYRILLEYAPWLRGPGTSQAYSAIIAVPTAVAAAHADPLQGAATQAWRWAREHDDLQAKQAAYCTFYYQLHNTGQWLLLA